MSENNYKEIKEKLKSIIESPRLYLSEHFTDLRTNIDKDYALISLDGEYKEENNNIWNKMINRVNEYEQECLNKITKKGFSQEIRDETNQLIETVQTGYVIRELHEEQLFKLQEIIFINQTIFYLQNDHNGLLYFKDGSLLKNKLIIVKNLFLNEMEIKSLKNK